MQRIRRTLCSDKACIADGVSIAGSEVFQEGTNLTEGEYEAKYLVVPGISSTINVSTSICSMCVLAPHHHVLRN